MKLFVLEATFLNMLSAAAVLYRPENEGISSGTNTLPAMLDLAQSHRSPAIGSFWSSSYIHASNNHDYLVISHVMNSVPFWGPNETMYRGSILDITDPSQYKMFEFFSNKTDAFSVSGSFNATYSDYGYGVVDSTDPLSKTRTWSSVPGVEFDLGFEYSSPVLLNGGLGSFVASNNPVYEWALPAGKTDGWILVNGSKVSVDSTRSLTWYDRQWGGSPSDWTWLQLHLNVDKAGATSIPLSVWWWNTTTDNKGLATARQAGGKQEVIPVESLKTSNRTYKSAATGFEYPLDWTLTLSDGTKLFLSSVRDDQELHADGGRFPAYTGYISVSGIYKGERHVTGYGLVDAVQAGST